MQKKKLLVYGIQSISEAVKENKNFTIIYFQKGLKNERVQSLLKELYSQNIPVHYVPVVKLNRLTGKNHQGVVGLISPIKYYKTVDVLLQVYEKGLIPLLLILDRITDVRNFGAIVRSAECMGVNAIIIPQKETAQINADAVKTSAGALHNLPVCREKSLEKTLHYLKESGLQIVAATEKTKQTIMADIDLTLPTAIILGSEDQGIHPALLKLADSRVKIPMQGSINSLNVSVATGIFLYEVVRQRRQ